MNYFVLRGLFVALNPFFRKENDFCLIIFIFREMISYSRQNSQIDRKKLSPNVTGKRSENRKKQ
jgi:hypothetical protein